MTLAKYKQKRNFDKTPEPKGKVKRKKPSKLLYIIQKHAASHLHYDFRLELNGVLLSWAVPKGPCLDPSVKRLAMHVEDHPVEYGSFEGIIPKGQYGGGTVMLWDKGEWIPEDDDPSKAYAQGNMKFRLKGKKLTGLWKLIRINQNDKTWLLIKAKDEAAKNIKKYDVTEAEPNSVLTHQNLDEIAANYKNIWGPKGILKPKIKKKRPVNISKKSKNFPRFNFDINSSKIPNKFSPQLATLVDKPPIGKQWIHEIKFDGYRIIAIKKNGKTKLLSRNNIDWTNKFDIIAQEINSLPIENIIFDGELVVLDKNRKSNFQQLQNSIKDNAHIQFYYYIFDLPFYDKYKLTNLPLLKRKDYLKKILKSFPSHYLLYSDHIVGSGQEILKKACELTFEGIISKDTTAPYLSTRTKTWLKSKCNKRQEFVIGGYTHPQGSRNHFGSLLIGTYNKKGELVYNGNVGTGFTNSTLRSLHKLLKKLHSSNNPFSSKPPKINKITWVKPSLVGEVEFTEWTEEGNLRHPSFKGLRTDKKAKNVIKEVAMPSRNISKNAKNITKNSHTNTRIKKTKFPFKISNPNKILYPEDEITKEDIAEYYETIQKWILPYIKNRPLTLVRCPSGYKKCFYQKHIKNHSSDALHSITIKEKNGTDEYIYLEDITGLMTLVQLGVLEIHPWGSQIKNVEYPDIIIFDLDPSPEVKWEKVVATAKNIKKYLAKLNLKSFIKTTGGKGLHVVIPISADHTWNEIKNFSKAFVNLLVEANPTEYISKMNKLQRKGKIFIDYLRNQKGATAIAPYSTRARAEAPVSTPLAWSELTTNQKDTYFTIKNLPARLKKLKKDPWAHFFKIRQSLPKKLF